MNRESQEGRRTTESLRHSVEDTDQPKVRRGMSEVSEEPSSAKKTEEATPKRLPLVVRILLWILRKSIVPLLLVLALVGGAFLGYVLLGEGDSSDVWKWETWRHLYDLIFLDS
ncbi:DNA-directed RNA polymerase subunit beta [Paenibacillus daejeonensis]|uniref:DNA-directed RNA polymerase subunit beta n=1 Tax=Paenibacillus daejeonensis TaxID=135193 RepID=UPI00036FC1A1|nr:DNA-directed RNA polymerase subunit beta [Paenibacillus daejeonensis]